MDARKKAEVIHCDEKTQILFSLSVYTSFGHLCFIPIFSAAKRNDHILEQPILL